MENDSESKTCDNCRNNFPTDKIDLHQAYCFRNIKKCPQCDKMIDINQKETHETQQHTNKKCQLCKQQFSPQLFQSHPESCPRKPVSCEFCENTYAQIQVVKHKQSCGSRTQTCEICHRLIQIRQIPGHTERCQKRAQQRRAQRIQVSQDVVRNHNRNENDVPSRERQNSQNVRDRRKSSAGKNIVPKPAKIKPSHMIGPEAIKHMIDPVPISIRMAMNKVKEQPRLPLKSKN